MPLNLIFVQPGNYSIEDDGIPGNNTSVIKDGNGVVIFTFGHPADALGFTTSTAGVNVTVNFTDSMGAANFTLGNLANAAESMDSITIQNIQTTGTVTLVSNNGITEGSDVDAAPDITAGAVIMSAMTGIGSAGNEIETRTGLFEAETTTGGIAIANIGAVQIGGISPDVDGLDVATSGDITFLNTGSIFLTEGNTVTAAEVVHGGGISGNVTLAAIGPNSDIIGNVDNGAVSVPRGSATLIAGRDIQLGTIGADFNNDVVTNNAVTFSAGRDILIDGFADILSDNFGLNTGADLTLTAGRNIGVLNLAGSSASVAASGSGGGDAIITTGVGGTLTVNGPGSFGIGSTSGNVTISADRMLIDAASGISAPAGLITIAPVTPGRGMLLGSASDAALALELSDTELNRLFATNLILGNTNTGNIRVISALALTAAGIAPDMIIRSGGNIIVESSVTTLQTLRLSAVGDVYQTAASTITTGTLQVFVDSVDNDPGSGNIAGLAGALAVNNNTIAGNLDADILNGTGQANFLQGLGGNDTLRGFGGADMLDGGSGADTMFGGLGNDVFYVDSASDVVTEAVGEGSDRIATSVSYALQAGSSIEILEAITLGDTTAINLSGNALNQTITGNNGNNLMVGGGGNDIFNGAGGDDTIVGNSSASTMNGGAGNDTYFVNDTSDAVVEASGGGNDRVAASVSYTLLASSEVETLEAASLTSVNAITFTGNVFVNLIIGNNGANVLDGKGGMDTLNGAGGADTFAFTTALGAGNVDTILGFVSATDKIGLDDAIFTAIMPGALNAGAFFIGAAAGDGDDRIIYNSATGALFYDPDGTGAAAQVQFATLSGHPALAGSDFILI